jgi:hypothetical protein
MRKLLLSIAGAAAILSAGALANRADAMTIGNPDGMHAAIADVAVIDKVHCVPGWLHHRWWYGLPHWDGCYRGRVFFGRRVFIGPRFHRRFFFRGRGVRAFRGGGFRFHGGRIGRHR